MQKGTVCGADRSVYKLNFFIGFFCIFALNSFDICKRAWLGHLPEMFTFLTTV